MGVSTGDWKAATWNAFAGFWLSAETPPHGFLYHVRPHKANNICTTRRIELAIGRVWWSRQAGDRAAFWARLGRSVETQPRRFLYYDRPMHGPSGHLAVSQSYAELKRRLRPTVVICNLLGRKKWNGMMTIVDKDFINQIKERGAEYYDPLPMEFFLPLTMRNSVP